MLDITTIRCTLSSSKGHLMLPLKIVRLYVNFVVKETWIIAKTGVGGR